MEYNKGYQTLTESGREIILGTNGTTRDIKRRLMDSDSFLGVIEDAYFCKGVRDGFLDDRVHYSTETHEEFIRGMQEGKIGLAVIIKYEDDKGTLYIGGRGNFEAVVKIIGKMSTHLRAIREVRYKRIVAIAHATEAELFGIEFLK